MVVRNIRARPAKDRENIQITFEVSAAVWGNMKLSAKSGSHENTVDYIAGTINSAFLDDAELSPGSAHIGGPDKRGDLDDDIPF